MQFWLKKVKTVEGDASTILMKQICKLQESIQNYHFFMTGFINKFVWILENTVLKMKK